MRRNRMTWTGYLPALLAIVALLFAACDLVKIEEEHSATPTQMGGSMQGVPLSLTGTTSTIAGSIIATATGAAIHAGNRSRKYAPVRQRNGTSGSM